MATVTRIGRRHQETDVPAWRYFRWWGEALRIARTEAARTGRRMRVRRSQAFPGYWLLSEVDA